MLIIDRFENDFAIIEMGETFFNVPQKALPENAKEGDVIEIRIKKRETEKRKRKIERLIDDVWE